jgi:hypothetical protein
VDPDSIREFVQRDWAAVEDESASFWAAHARTMTPSARMELSAALFHHVRTIRPSWPSATEREADLAHHNRVAEVLHAIAALNAR